MFVIVYNGFVILGPMVWNARRFSEVINEETGISVILDLRNDEQTMVTVNDDIKIYPVTSEPDPEYNPKMQYLHGPFWTFTDTHAVASMTVEQYPIEAIRNFLRQQIADVRWRKQHAGVEVEINGTAYRFPTDPATRVAFHHYLTSGTTNVNWKINQDTWLQLTDQHISTIFDKIVEHLQTSFDWEANKNNEITTATLETIESIILEE
jgi:predicted helicase